jgi:glutamyl-Q tRNA(Asp) synthetase
MSAITRFAPSPTGHLHLGHAHAAIFAHRAAGPEGRFLLRIEDIDPGRCDPAFETAIFEDFAWLGLSWEKPVRRQSAHLDDYTAALARLRDMDLLFPCFCTRRDIREEIARSAHAPHALPHSPEGPIYPGTCKRLNPAERRARLDAGDPHALRLDVAAAVRRTGPLTWLDRERGVQTATSALFAALFGDVVLARKDIATSYHLAVTVDDARQGITLVTRGDDLFAASHIHRLLQSLLDLPVPEWRHHGLLTDSDGNRLAKRNNPATIRTLRDSGHSPAEVRALAGFPD